MHSILECLSKFKTSLAYKSINTFFVAAQNENCIKIFYTFFVEVPRNPYENVETLYIFRQQYRRKMFKLRKKYIYTFSQFIHFALYQSPQVYVYDD